MQLSAILVVAMVTPVLFVLGSVIPYPENCQVIQQEKTLYKHNTDTGVYTIYPLGKMSAVKVCCDMEMEGGGWTVIQKRMDGSVNFFRPWDHYKVGFGEPDGEYWMGLNNMHYLTKSEQYELLVYMEDFDGATATAHYSNFSVAPECDEFKLTATGFTEGHGGARDALFVHNDCKFTTFDKDNDAWAKGNCAKRCVGGFWYNRCHKTNPNGVYRWDSDETEFSLGAVWATWQGRRHQMKTFALMIRPIPANLTMRIRPTHH